MHVPLDHYKYVWPIAVKSQVLVEKRVFKFVVLKLSIGDEPSLRDCNSPSHFFLIETIFTHTVHLKMYCYPGGCDLIFDTYPMLPSGSPIKQFGIAYS